MEKVDDGGVILVTGGFDHDDGSSGNSSDVNGGGRNAVGFTAVNMACLL